DGNPPPADRAAGSSYPWPRPTPVSSPARSFRCPSFPLDRNPCSFPPLPAKNKNAPPDAPDEAGPFRRMNRDPITAHLLPPCGGTGFGTYPGGMSDGCQGFTGPVPLPFLISEWKERCAGEGGVK